MLKFLFTDLFLINYIKSNYQSNFFVHFFKLYYLLSQSQMFAYEIQKNFFFLKNVK